MGCIGSVRSEYLCSHCSFLKMHVFVRESKEKNPTLFASRSKSDTFSPRVGMYCKGFRNLLVVSGFSALPSSFTIFRQDHRDVYRYIWYSCWDSRHLSSVDWGVDFGVARLCPQFQSTRNRISLLFIIVAGTRKDRAKKVLHFQFVLETSIDCKAKDNNYELVWTWTQWFKVLTS